MNQLPNAATVTVADAKVRDYLLNSGNDQNRGKALLFGLFGFVLLDWHRLSQALAEHARDNEVVSEKQTIHGVKYIVRCNIKSPDGRNPCIESIWIVDSDSASPRFLTAYGLKRRDERHQ